MYKTDFYITSAAKRNHFNEPVQYKFDKVHGWGETFGAPDGSIIELRFDKRPRQWRVTENSTGMAVLHPFFQTRAEAMAAVTPELLQKIADAIKAPYCCKVKEALADHILQSSSQEVKPNEN